MSGQKVGLYVGVASLSMWLLCLSVMLLRMRVLRGMWFALVVLGFVGVAVSGFLLEDRPRQEDEPQADWPRPGERAVRIADEMRSSRALPTRLLDEFVQLSKQEKLVLVASVLLLDTVLWFLTVVGRQAP